MGLVTSDPARYRPARGELLWVCRALGLAVVCRYYFGVVGDLSRYFVDYDLRPFVTGGDYFYCFYAIAVIIIVVVINSFIMFSWLSLD